MTEKQIGKDTETRIVNTIKDENAATRKIVKDENAATRKHMADTVGMIRSDTKHTKTRMDHVKVMIRRLLSKFGIGTDDIPP